MSKAEAKVIKAALDMIPLGCNNYHEAWYKMTPEAKQGIFNIIDNMVGICSNVQN